MKPTATGAHDFEQFVSDGFTSVDKTALLYCLANKSIGVPYV